AGAGGTRWGIAQALHRRRPGVAQLVDEAFQDFPYGHQEGRFLYHRLSNIQEELPGCVNACACFHGHEVLKPAAAKCAGEKCAPLGGGDPPPGSMMTSSLSALPSITSISSLAM